MFYNNVHSMIHFQEAELTAIDLYVCKKLRKLSRQFAEKI